MESGGKVFQKDASHNLSHEKLIYNINKRHPRLMTRDPQSNFFLLKFIQHKSLCTRNTHAAVLELAFIYVAKVNDKLTSLPMVWESLSISSS